MQGVAPLSQTFPIHPISCTFNSYTLVCFPVLLLGKNQCNFVFLLRPPLSRGSLITTRPRPLTMGHLPDEDLSLLSVPTHSRRSLVNLYSTFSLMMSFVLIRRCSCQCFYRDTISKSVANQG